MSCPREGVSNLRYITVNARCKDNLGGKCCWYVVTFDFSGVSVLSRSFRIYLHFFILGRQVGREGRGT